MKKKFFILTILLFSVCIIYLVGCGGGGGGGGSGSGVGSSGGSGNSEIGNGNNNNLAPVNISFSSKPLNNVYYTKADLPQSVYVDYFPNEPSSKLTSFSANFYFNERLFSITNLFKDLYPQSRRLISLSSPFNKTSLSIFSLENLPAGKRGKRLISHSNSNGARLNPTFSIGLNKLANKILYNSYLKKMYVISADYSVEVLGDIEGNINYRTIALSSKVFNADIYAPEDKLYILFEDSQNPQVNQKKIAVLKNESFVKEISLPHEPTSIYVNSLKKYFYILYDTGKFAYFSSQTDELIEEFCHPERIIKLIPNNSSKNEVIFIDELLNLNVLELLGNNQFVLNQIKLLFYPHDVIFDSENRVILLLDYKNGKIKKLIPQMCESVCSNFIESEVNTSAYPYKFFLSSNGKNVYLTYQDENAIEGINTIEKWNYDKILYREDYLISAVFPVFIQEVNKNLFILEDIWWELIDERGYIEITVTNDKGRTESNKIAFQVKREGVPIEQPKILSKQLH